MENGNGFITSFLVKEWHLESRQAVFCKDVSSRSIARRPFVTPEYRGGFYLPVFQRQSALVHTHIGPGYLLAHADIFGKALVAPLEGPLGDGNPI